VEAPAGATSAGASISTSTATKAKHTPIRFTLKNEDEPSANKKRRSGSRERDAVGPEKRRVPIRNAEDRKYDNLPACKYNSFLIETITKATIINIFSKRG